MSYSVNYKNKLEEKKAATMAQHHSERILSTRMRDAIGFCK